MFDADAYGAYYVDLRRGAAPAGPIWAVHSLGCTEWSVRPKWRYRDPLGAQNKSHPVLIVQPKYDPVGALGDALAVREGYRGARLLVQNSHGHCSITAPSVFTVAYLEQGKLPAEGTICEPDEIPFVGQVSDVRVMSAGDGELVDALRGLSEVVPIFGVY